MAVDRKEYTREWKRRRTLLLGESPDRKWARENPERIKRNRDRYQWRLKNVDAVYARRMEKLWHNRRTIKHETFIAYGGAHCVCCETDLLDFLTLDHPKNDGAEDRRRLMNGRQIGGLAFYRKLKSLGFPPGYQVLCYNCNCGKNANGGVCPHKKESL